MIYLFAAVIAAAAISWIIVHKRRSASASPASEASGHSEDSGGKSTQYHSVAIRMGALSCAAVQKLDGVRLLAEDAPLLPLPNCGIEDCECRYVHHEDRREAGDRRSPFPAGGIRQLIGDRDKEKRTGSDRRREEEELH